MNNDINLKNNTKRIAFLAMIVLITTCIRFLPFALVLPYNFSPVTAIALFSGLYFTNRWQSFIIPLVCIWVSDLFINYLYTHQFQPFYTGFYWQYGTYALIVLIGIIFSQNIKLSNLILGSLSASILFFMITNFGTWFTFDMYPKTTAGLAMCYVAGIPFFKYTILSDFLFTAALFAIVQVVNKKYPVVVA